MLSVAKETSKAKLILQIGILLHSPRQWNSSGRIKLIATWMWPGQRSCVWPGTHVVYKGGLKTQRTTLSLTSFVATNWCYLRWCNMIYWKWIKLDKVHTCNPPKNIVGTTVVPSIFLILIIITVIQNKDLKSNRCEQNTKNAKVKVAQVLNTPEPHGLLLFSNMLVFKIKAHDANSCVLILYQFFFLHMYPISLGFILYNL